MGKLIYEICIEFLPKYQNKKQILYDNIVIRFRKNCKLKMSNKINVYILELEIKKCHILVFKSLIKIKKIFCQNNSKFLSPTYY